MHHLENKVIVVITATERTANFNCLTLTVHEIQRERREEERGEREKQEREILVTVGQRSLTNRVPYYPKKSKFMNTHQSSSHDTNVMKKCGATSDP